jgi:hypothetical protein
VLARQRRNGIAEKARAWRGSLWLTPFNRWLFCGILDFADAAQPDVSRVPESR